MSRSANKQLLFNMISSAISYIIALGLPFVLTPFIVSRVGLDAYGFLGLSNTIINYTLMVTIALNSMMGRYVSIRYHEGKHSEASRYIASAFWCNIGFTLVVVPLAVIFTLNMEHFITIPTRLVDDVKMLFLLLMLAAFISFATNAINVSTFIRNRLDMANVRNIVSNILRAIVLLSSFLLFVPHLWYYGLAAMVCSTYMLIANWRLYIRLTPELSIRPRYFSWRHCIEMIKSGIWNLLTQMGMIINQGLDLLLANFFMNATAMGILSIVKTIPSIMHGLFGTLCGNFSPRYVELYAKGRMDELRAELLKSVRILGFFTAIPTAIIFGYADIFYCVWLPGQDYELFYRLTIITCMALSVALPLESLWFIFTLTDTVKHSATNYLGYSAASIISVVTALLSVHSDFTLGVYILCGIPAFYEIARYVTFLPLHGAKVLSFKRTTFYAPLLRILLVVAITSGLSLLVKILFLEYTWASLLIGSAVTSLIAVSLSYYFVLTRTDRMYIKAKIFRRNTSSIS